MRKIELSPKATEDLEAIWCYGYVHYGVKQADEYIDRLSAAFSMLATHQIGTFRPELGDRMHSLPVEKHVVFFISSRLAITVVRILSQSVDVIRHLPTFIA